MLVIGRRGSESHKQPNILESLYSCIQSDADMIMLDVYLTKDKVPVLVHGSHFSRNNISPSAIGKMTYAELYANTEDRPSVPLNQILDEFFGSILLIIDLKGRGTGAIVTELIKKKYIKKKSDWDNIILSSFRGSELASARSISKAVNLAMLHSQNAFVFIAYHRRIKLAAVGFHRLYLNSFALEVAKRTGLFTFVYTVNRPKTAIKLAQKGIDGIVTDRPEVIMSELSKQA